MVKTLEFTNPRTGEYVSETIQTTGETAFQIVGDGTVLVYKGTDDDHMGIADHRQVNGYKQCCVLTEKAPADTYMKIRVTNSDHGVFSMLYTDPTE